MDDGAPLTLAVPGPAFIIHSIPTLAFFHALFCFFFSSSLQWYHNGTYICISYVIILKVSVYILLVPSLYSPNISLSIMQPHI